jgi:hypothetical protein
LVDHAGNQWNFRTDDGEIRIYGFRRGEVFRGWQKLTELSDTRVAWRAVDLVTFLRQTPRNRMFTAAAADDKNFHEIRIFTRLESSRELSVYRGKLECS